MVRFVLTLLTAATLAACGGLPDPDGAWQVTLTSTEAEDLVGCAEGEEYSVINQSYEYQMYVQEGQVVDLRIDGVTFASGQYTDGCNVIYDSPAYLDDYDGNEVQWQLSGSATVDGPAGGCVATEGLDWEGEETIVVSRSETDRLPVGCTRTVTVTGSLVSG